MQPHLLYLSNTSGVKVGITRQTQVPTRWIDQGARQALPVARVPTRHDAGRLEVAFKQYLDDRTNWRGMLKDDCRRNLAAGGTRARRGSAAACRLAGGRVEIELED